MGESSVQKLLSSTNLIIPKAGPIIGTITVPGDKSIAHRALILAAIASGVSMIEGVPDSEDCASTRLALQAMGVKIEQLSQKTLRVHGVGLGGLHAPTESIDCGNSGTTMRLLAGLLSGQAFDSTLIGDSSLLKRPMERVRQPLELMGASLKTTQGTAPIYIRGRRQLHGIKYTLPMPSAQVKSCILLAGLYANSNTTVIERQMTRDHTERMLQSMSYPCEAADHEIRIQPQTMLHPNDFFIPGDLSSAAFFIVAASIVPGSRLVLKNIGINPTRTGLLTILELMGADIDMRNERLLGHEPVADIYVRHVTLKGIKIPANLVPLAIDEYPIIFIAAACAVGQTIVHGIEELRHKESDRIAAMARGLEALGIWVYTTKNSICIQGGTLRGGEVDSAGDHRIAMAFAIAGAVALEPVKVTNTQCIATSFPRFLQTAEQFNWLMQEEYSDGA